MVQVWWEGLRVWSVVRKLYSAMFGFHKRMFKGMVC